ncbi:MAG TPA: hypothetical protein VF185_00785 [Patescibacteria group bacterium]
MPERKLSWEKDLVPSITVKDKEPQINLDLTTYGLMAVELAKRIEESSTDNYPNNLLYLPGSSYLAAIVSKIIGIYPVTKIDLSDSPESVFVPEDDNLVIVGNQNVTNLLFFGNSLNVLFKPKSVTIGVLFEREGELNKADISVFTTKHKVKFPALPELKILP